MGTSEDVPHSSYILYLPRPGQQRLLSCLYQRIGTPVAFPAEIVIVDGPEHDATQPVVADVPRLWIMPELHYELYLLKKRIQTWQIIAWSGGILDKLIFAETDNK